MRTGYPKRMATLTKISVKEDFSAWALETAALIEQGRLEEIDVPALAEEVQDLGISREHALDSQILRLLKHLLKCAYQPVRRSPSWRASINDARDQIDLILMKNPSLRRQLEPPQIDNLWRRARRGAAIETELPQSTFPDVCPWDIDKQIRDHDWLP